MSYLLLKQMHVALAALSAGGFIMRWTWRRNGVSLASARATRVVPHLVDTLLLITGIALAWPLGPLPMLPAWLSVKLGALLAYIVLGIIAMRSTPRTRMANVGFAAALITFAWMVSIARTKSPLGFLAAAVS